MKDIECSTPLPQFVSYDLNQAASGKTLSRPISRTEIKMARRNPVSVCCDYKPPELLVGLAKLLLLRLRLSNKNIF